jgi:hypothetical protein
MITSLSKGATVELLHLSIAILFIFGVALAIGLVGELRWESEKNARITSRQRREFFSRPNLYRTCEMVVIVGVLSEFGLPPARPTV